MYMPRARLDAWCRSGYGEDVFFMRCQVMVTVLIILALFAIGETAIASQPPFSYGLLQSSCVPWDGPAIDIRLTTEPAQCKRMSGPYIAIGVWRGLPIRAGHVAKFGPTLDTGFASRCTKVGDCDAPNPARSYLKDIKRARTLRAAMSCTSKAAKP